MAYQRKGKGASKPKASKTKVRAKKNLKTPTRKLTSVLIRNINASVAANTRRNQSKKDSR